MKLKQTNEPLMFFPGVCSWCLMAYSWGFTSSNYYPPSLSAWSKARLGFVTPIEITEPGTYTIAAQQDNPQVSFTAIRVA
jgi:hypothetical protein